MLAQVAPVVSASETATASECASLASTREPFAIIQLSVVRALAGNCTRSAILIYNALATHADPTGHCWPGRARLADITGLSERQVSRATAELERKGLLAKEGLPAGRVDYWLLPAPVTAQTLPPDTGVRGGVTPVSPITDQLTDQITERAPEPEPPPPATPPPEPTRPALSDCQLQTRTPLPTDWQLPDDWKVWAIDHRPDLSASLEAIAANFFDFHASKGTRSSCWLAEWRRWVRRERAPRTALKAPTATRNAQPYPTPPNQPKNAVSAAVDTALDTALDTAVERSRQAFYDLCRSQGIDPATGLRMLIQQTNAPPSMGSVSPNRCDTSLRTAGHGELPMNTDWFTGSKETPW